MFAWLDSNGESCFTFFVLVSQLPVFVLIMCVFFHFFSWGQANLLVICLLKISLLGVEGFLLFVCAYLCRQRWRLCLRQQGRVRYVDTPISNHINEKLSIDMVTGKKRSKMLLPLFLKKYWNNCSKGQFLL